MSDIVTVQYVVKKDNGQMFKLDQVPAEGERIMYPGQRVLIQTNGNYTRLYPEDVENHLE